MKVPSWFRNHCWDFKIGEGYKAQNVCRYVFPLKTMCAHASGSSTVRKPIDYLVQALVKFSKKFYQGLTRLLLVC